MACDYWEPQDYYIEVWVEKEALGNVVERACDPLKTPFLSCKGYLSASEAYDAGKRFEKALCKGKKCKLIHLGDHDSSGIDMTRDNEERVNMFANSRSIDIERIALNHDQILEFSPPPNPAKVKDPRAKRYIKEYGTTSYELDALEPSVIESLITESIKPLIDLDLWNETKEEENDMKESLKSLRQYI
ncbi:MAG: hypothetical protein GY928_05415 [Colwellia sp.]|nr:hypothetical protein [Colwellia sp.]